MANQSGKNNSGLIIAVIFIVVGALWALREIGVNLRFEEIFAPFTWIFSKLGRIIFSWPMILIIAGLVMVSGKRPGGWILVALGSVFLIPKIFMLPGFSFTLIFPLALLLTGIYIVSRHL